MEEAKYLFHYTKAETLKKILSEQTLLFNNINKTNDPYENKILDTFRRDELFPNEIISLRSDDESYDINSELDTQDFYFQHYTDMKNRIVKVICFSKGQFQIRKISRKIRLGYLHPRMWAQYGNNSKGACMVFNKEKLVKAIRKTLEQDFYIFDNEITYVDIFDTLHIDEITKLIKKRNHDVFKSKEKKKRNPLVKNMIENIEIYFFRKDIDWADENEYRILIINNEHNSDIEPKIINIDIKRMLEYVILGECFEYKENNNIKNITSQICSLCKKNNIKLYQLDRDIYRAKYIIRLVK
jgi:hypothetical protein